MAATAAMIKRRAFHRPSAGARPASGRGRKKPWRYRWVDEVRDEVLARLLELNKKRAEEERLAGAAVGNAKPKKQANKRKSASAGEAHGLF